MYMTLQHAMFLFILFSTLGWILEFTYRTLSNRTLANPGVLFGPYVPIYGFGALLLIMLYSYASHLPILYRIGIYFFTISLMEYVTGELLLLVFKKRYWDYTDDLLNIRGHVCLPFSIYWALLAIGFEKTFYPVSMQLLQNVSNMHVLYFDAAICSIMFLDIIFVTGIPTSVSRWSQSLAGRHFDIDRSSMQRIVYSMQERFPQVPAHFAALLSDTDLADILRRFYERLRK